jgi:hypothetical protein
MTSYNIRVKRTNKVKSTVQTGVALEGRFRDLLDVDVSSASDKYLIMYDSTTQKYIAVNPDDILVNAVEEPTSPGLPAQFIDKLDVDLDDKIDLDGGTW